MLISQSLEIALFILFLQLINWTNTQKILYYSLRVGYGNIDDKLAYNSMHHLPILFIMTKSFFE